MPSDSATTIDIGAMNAKLEASPPEEILSWAVELFSPEVLLTCSFQHDGVVLAHMLTAIAPTVPIVFLDTGFHFLETLAYRDEIVRRFDLNLRILTAANSRREPAAIADRRADLFRRDPDLCCRLHKVEPLQAELEGVRCWLNGRRRDHAGTRRALPVVERFEGGIHKVNPLASWTVGDTLRYLHTHAIPEHPLFKEGYRSIGCAPCTRPTLAGEHERAGRWPGSSKVECGLHTFLKPTDKNS